MPLTFLNGGSPDYLGQLFTDSDSLLSNINATLQSAGLTTITNSPNLLEMNLLATDNSDSAAIRFTTNITANNTIELQVILAHDSTFSISSPTYKCFATNGQQNRLWLTADQDHLVLCIQDFGGLCYGLHAGYLLRLDPDDTFGFVIGIPCTSVYKSDAYRNQAPISHRYNYTIAKSYATGDKNWFAPATYFPNNSAIEGGEYPSTITGSYFGAGFMNRHANCLVPFGSSLINSSNNAGQNNHIGNVNALNNKSILGEYYAIEGIDTGSEYVDNVPGNQLGQRLYFRGVVQNVVVGMSHLLDGIQIEDLTGKRYISVGGLTYGGIRIA